MILVVDDDDSRHKLLQRPLGSEPVELLFAKSACEAMDSLRRSRPDCILMDVELPDGDGIDAVTKIKSISADRNFWLPDEDVAAPHSSVA